MWWSIKIGETSYQVKLSQMTSNVYFLWEGKIALRKKPLEEEWKPTN